MSLMENCCYHKALCQSHCSWPTHRPRDCTRTQRQPKQLSGIFETPRRTDATCTLNGGHGRDCIASSLVGVVTAISKRLCASPRCVGYRRLPLMLLKTDSHSIILEITILLYPSLGETEATTLAMASAEKSTRSSRIDCSSCGEKDDVLW